jgi:glycosyltransferase involved in cell wall biosynthesis
MSLKKCRVIWSIRNAQLNSGSLPKSTLLLARLLAKYSSHVDSLVYNSTVAQKTHEQMGYDSKKSIVIHNGFDLNHLDRHPIESLRQNTLNLYELNSKVRYIGFVSRHHPQKDIQTFLNVVKILRQQKERIKFITCGNGLGPHDSDFLDQLKSYGIQDVVSPLGVVENISDLYSCFDALLLTSKEESLPNVIGEAMVCGVPCMSTRVGDVEHLLHSDQLSEIGDSEGLSYHLLKILDAPKSERQIIIQRQKETLKHHFNILKQQEQLEQLYLQS